MTLQAKAIITEATDGKSLGLIDVTGLYNVTTNPGGYGAPNPTVGSITTATLAITKLNQPLSANTVYTPFSVFQFGVFPNTGGIGHEVLNTAIGLGADEPFVPGVYQFVYTISDGTNTSAYAFVNQLDAAAQICVDTATLAILPPTCTDNSCCIEDATSGPGVMYFLLQAARLNVKWLKYQQANDIYTYLSRVCGCSKFDIC